MAPLEPFTWVLCDQAGNPISGSHMATNRRLLACRNREMEARLTLSLHDRAAIELFEVLNNGIPQLRVYLGSTLVFSGYWTPMTGGNTIDSPSTVNLVFRDAFDRLRYRWTYSPDIYTQVDAGLIAMDMIDRANDTTLIVPGWPTGIAVDPAWVEPTMLRDRTYYLKVIQEAIIQLTEVINPFDWFPTYLDPRDNAGDTMRFNVVRSLGTDRPSAKFEFGEGTLENCTGYSFSTTLPVTTAVAIGNGSWHQSVAPSYDTYGFYGLQVSVGDVSGDEALAEKSIDALRVSPAHVTEFKPDPTVAPLPFRDFWIGDTIRWNVSDGAFQQRIEPRVQTIEIGLDDSDNVSDVVIGIDPEAGGAFLAPANSTRRYVQEQRDVLRRLNSLERSF